MEVLLFSLFVVTWASVGIHVIKEFIRFNGERDD
jgi:hypothetical protein